MDTDVKAKLTSKAFEYDELCETYQNDGAPESAARCKELAKAYRTVVSDMFPEEDMNKF